MSKNRADCYYDAQRGAYVISAKHGGNEVVVFNNGKVDVGKGEVALTSIKVGANALVSNISNVMGWVGSCAAITAVPTAAVAIGTITGATGLAVGDVIFATPKTNQSASHVSVAGFFVPTANTLNVLLQNIKPDSQGSYLAAGFDIIALRKG